MAEDEARHRHEMDLECLRADVEADSDDRRKEFVLGLAGSIFAFVALLTLIVIGGVLLYAGRDVSGFASIALGLTSIGGVAVFRRPSKKKPGPTGNPKAVGEGSSEAEAKDPSSE